MESPQQKSCYNCSNPLLENALYCPWCGQKDTDGRIPIRQFFSEFVESVFNLDSRFFKTLSYIFIPGGLTQEYFEGKHKSYSHPLRLFFIIAVVHFTLLGIVANSNLGMENTSITEMNDRLKKREVYQLIEDYENNQTQLPDEFASRETLDSLKKYILKNGDIELDTFSSMSFLTFDLDSLKINSIEITNNDAVILSHEEIFAKYKITDAFTKIWVQQQLKVNKNPKSAILFGIGNMLWMLFILLPLVALFMKLLYIRRKFFFIEHLVFLYHWHTVAFIIMGVFFLLMTRIQTGWLGLFFLLIVLFGFIALKKYYKQGIIKSFLKYVFILFFYVTVMMVLAAATSLVSMLAF